MLVQTRVSVVGNSGDGAAAAAAGGGGAAGEAGTVLGVFADCLCVRLASLDSLQPGSSFTLHSQMFRWLKPITTTRRQGSGGVGGGGGGGGGAPAPAPGPLGAQKCRVQSRRWWGGG